MSHDINWAVCPAATHYLPSGFGPSLSTFWRLVDGVPVERWQVCGSTLKGAPLELDGLFDRLIERPVVDFSKAPERATHYVYSERTTIEPGWYVADGVKMRLCGRDDEYTFRLDDVRPGCGLTLIERPNVAPDWDTAPKDATHYAPPVTMDSFYCPPSWLKAEGDAYLYASWENDWYWHPCGALEKGRAETLISRPVAEPAPSLLDWAAAPDDATHCWNQGPNARWYKIDESTGKAWLLKWGEWELCYTEEGERYDISDLEPRPAAEFVPVDFSGDVRDYGPAAKLAEMGWSKAPKWATLFLVNVQHPKMYAWTSALEKGAKFERLDGADCIGYLLPEFWQVVGERPSVDWLQAPEGATAFARGSWYKINHLWIDGQWEYQHPDNGDHAYDYPDAQYKPEPPIIWNGEGNPPVGTDCVVTPHNTQWGFDNLDSRRVKVLGGYGGEFVWLMELHSDGSDSFSFITTRSDKVNFAPYRTPEQVASDKRIEAAQVWLKDIEREYGVEAADKCEDILMDFEKRKKAGE